MRSLVLLAVGALMACGDGDGSTQVIDAPSGEPVDAAGCGCLDRCTACNPFAPVDQQGCPSGQRCGIASTATAMCLACIPDVAGLAVGEACTLASGADPCSAGLACNQGHCVTPCVRGDHPCAVGFCPPTGTVALCHPACDPLAPVCGAGESCQLAPVGSDEGPGCAPTGN